MKVFNHRTLTSWTIFRFSGAVDAFEGFKDNIENFTPKYAQYINRPPEKIKSAIDVYKQLQFTKRELGHIWKVNPAGLLLCDEGNDIQKLSAMLKSEYRMNEQEIRRMVFRNPQVLSYEVQDLKNKILTIQQSLSIPQYDNINRKEQIKDIFSTFPKVLEGNTEVKLHKVLTVLESFASLTKEQIGQTALKYPYLIDIFPQFLEANLKNIIRLGLSAKQMNHIIGEISEVLSLNPPYFNVTRIILQELITDKRKLVELIMKHPKILSLCPHSMIAPKINLLKGEGLDHEQIGQVLYLYPEIFLRSVGSVKLSINYLKKFYKYVALDDPFFPQILTYSYWEQIRPKGELLRAKDIKFGWKEILLKTDEEFIKTYQISAEDLEKKRGEKPKDVREVDSRKKYFHSYMIN